MKERLIITLVFIVFMISIVSSSYKCADDTTLLEDIGSLKLGEIDHINGINNDNRIENLRLLCPNCNSQEPTFCRGRKGLGASMVI